VSGWLLRQKKTPPCLAGVEGFLMGPAELESATSPLSAVCSNQLSYEPECTHVKCVEGKNSGRCQMGQAQFVARFAPAGHSHVLINNLRYITSRASRAGRRQVTRCWSRGLDGPHRWLRVAEAWDERRLLATKRGQRRADSVQPAATSYDVRGVFSCVRQGRTAGSGGWREEWYKRV